MRGEKEMYDKFGEMSSYKEINELAENLANEGDIESLSEMAKENGIPEDFVDLYLEGEIPKLCDALIAAVGKLVLVPLVFLAISYAFGFRDISLLSLMIMFAAPTAVSSFQMAKQMDGDGDLAGQIVVFTSAFSIVTVFGWIFLLKQFSLI